MKFLKICIILFSILLSDYASSGEIPVTIETLKGIIIESAFKTAKATFDLSLYKDGEPRGEFQGVAVFEAPDKIASKLFGPLGLTLMDVIGKDGILQVYIPPKDELYQGNLPKDSSLIFGILGNQYQYAMEETGENYILYLLKPEEGFLSIRAKFFFDKIELKNRKVDILNDGKSQLRIEFNKLREDFPLEATIFLPSGVSIVIKNKEVILNEVPSEELFFLKKAEGREVKELRGIVDKKIR